jgi:hypothetical protein
MLMNLVLVLVFLLMSMLIDNKASQGVHMTRGTVL